MSLEVWLDQIYGYATGWLGWSDAEAMTTPIPRLLLAFEARLDCLRRTNPFGGGDDPPAPAHRAPPDAVAARMRQAMAFFGAGER